MIDSDIYVFEKRTKLVIADPSERKKWSYHRSQALDARIKTDPSCGFQRINGQPSSSPDSFDHSTNGRQTFHRVIVRLPVTRTNRAAECAFRNQFPCTSPQYPVCLLAGPVREEQIHILQPGQQYTFTSDPSDGFAFHGKGLYRVTARYQFDPATVIPISQMPEENWRRPGVLVLYPNREILLKTPNIDVSPNVWIVYLAE